MASAYKRTYRSANGKKCECEQFTLECKVGDGFHRVPGFTDRKASEELGRRVERLAELKAAGEQPDSTLRKWLEHLPRKQRNRLAELGLLSGPAAAATQPLSAHLDDYRQALLDGVASNRQKGPATLKHADIARKRIEVLLAGIEATRLSDVTIERVGRYLAERRDKGLSVQTSNHYLANVKSFLNWMIRSKRASESPLAGLGKAQVTAKGRKLVRRALERGEAALLLAKTRNGEPFYGMTGEERYWLYRLALESALRSSELRALKRANLRLDGTEPSVWLADDDTKSRKGADLPLKVGTAAELRAFVANKLPAAPLFPNMPISTDVAYLLRHDLKAAEIPFETSAGVVDFHALRVTCITWLADANVSTKTLQAFARHSTPVLTLNVYARTLHGSLGDAASRLPDLSTPVVSAALVAASGAPAIASATGGRTGGKTGGKPVPAGSSSSTAIQTSGTRGGSRHVAKSSGIAASIGCAATHSNEREWMGIEPTKPYLYRASPILKTGGPTRRPDTPVSNPPPVRWFLQPRPAILCI